MLLEKLHILCQFAWDQRVGPDIDNHRGDSSELNRRQDKASARLER
jgi:hypothetical protein